jgi:hypothetical protein
MCPDFCHSTVIRAPVISVMSPSSPISMKNYKGRSRAECTCAINPLSLGVMLAKAGINPFISCNSKTPTPRRQENKEMHVW